MTIKLIVKDELDAVIEDLAAMTTQRNDLLAALREVSCMGGTAKDLLRIRALARAAIAKVGQP